MGQKSIKILGFEIEKTTSFTSLAAFLLSVWGVSQASYYYLRGSHLNLVSPDRVIVFIDACHAKKFGDILNFIVPITVVNNAQRGYSSVLKHIKLSFNLGKKYIYNSEAYVKYGSSTQEKSGLVDCDGNPKLGWYIQEMESVPAEVIAGGTSYSRKIMFVPNIPICENGGEICYRRNYLKASHGISMMAGLAKSTSRLSFDIRLEYDDGKKDEKACTIIINNDVVKGITSNRSIDGFCLESR